MKCFRCGEWDGQQCGCKDRQTIFHGDCRELLPELPKVDLVLTDPPYGLGICKKGSVGKNTKTKWKHRMREWGEQEWDVEPPSSETINQVVSQGKNAIVWGGNYFSLPPTPCWLIWDKCQRDFSFADGEIAWTNLTTAVRIKGISRGELTAKGRHHPTCKPVALISWCLGMAGDITTTLDPFMGSGTTLVSSKAANVQGIGIEIEEKYCEIAANRLRQAVLDFGE